MKNFYVDGVAWILFTIVVIIVIMVVLFATKSVACCACVLCCICVLFMHIDKEANRVTNDKTTKIRSVRSLSVKDEKSAKAITVFSMGYGEYRGRGYYAVYMEQEGGSYKIKKLEMNSVKLYFDVRDTDGAFVQYVVNGKGSLVGDYELHVPKDTVQERFD